MNIGAITCLTLSILFGILSAIFALFKENATIFISGFNTIPKEEREKYDKKKMSIDMGNSLFLWCIILLLGAIASYFIGNYCAIIATIIWLILFFKNVHMDLDKTFLKYKKNTPEPNRCIFFEATTPHGIFSLIIILNIE